MKNKIVILLLVMVVSGIFAFAGFSDAKLVFEDKRLDINSAERDDFSFPAIAEGDAYIISGPFAELEEKNTVYGIPVGKKSTYYYLVSNTDYETFSDIIMSDTDNIFGEMTWYIASVSDEDLVKKFDSAALRMDRWMQNYSNLVSLFEKSGYDESDAEKIDNLLAQLPDETIKISGFLKSQSSDSDYEKYRDDFLASADFDSSDIGELLIKAEGEGSKTGTIEVIIFFAASAVFLISFIFLIVSLIKKAKKKKSEELW